MIQVKNLVKCYTKNAPVLNGVDLTIEDGCVYGLVGVNGAGKSTLLRVLTGIFAADSGQVCVDGEVVFNNERVKKQIFFLPDEPFFTRNTTAKSLKKLYASTHDLDEKAFSHYLNVFHLNEKTPLRNLSKGMKRQVFVCLALAIAPKYLFLDEAFDGLDPVARVTLQRGLTDLAKEKGSVVIISSHSLLELQALCDTYGVLDNGKVISQQELGSHLGQLHKFQAAFEEDITKEDFPFECLSFTKTGRVVQLIARGEVQTLKNQIVGLNPMFVEEIPVNFEELFIGAATQRGYLQ
jgi:ABC-2 type transport system ATP-binding protein